MRFKTITTQNLFIDLLTTSPTLAYAVRNLWRPVKKYVGVYIGV